MDANGSLQIIERFYAKAECEEIYRRFMLDHDWPVNVYTVGGRRFALPRLQTWHADSGIRYSYRYNLLETRAWTPLLVEIRQRIEAYLNISFNSVLANLYRDGNDYVGWHADDEPELGERPFIASLTFGTARNFAFRHKKLEQQGEVKLADGALLIMHPEFQRDWQHSLPRDSGLDSGRINLTFRKVISP
ncbi:alpha-ketoglutarate-dependent dioxygenase AlkB family protein [Methylomonas koyamae]|uniref:alpha-ketoglutarate-dependent dioxygenase AlkB family protein n=1 Tax=Methylomonas koyamae TaxID=702114 RepID=UPI00112742EA|nr:alpha-ketoglutarate-dependent dioxygenase AlkB [Methylomonas koyamae]TPQ24630.1 alpha-ketoglutarate-dependent dioxygenase AlkB [Methylomonas koyamae]